MMRPVPPGEILREQLEELGMSATQLAAHLDVPTNRITGILNATRSLTADTALRLSKFFGTTAEFWLALQSNYELRKAELQAKPAAKVVPLWEVQRTRQRREQVASSRAARYFRAAATTGSYVAAGESSGRKRASKAPVKSRGKKRAKKA